MLFERDLQIYQILKKTKIIGRNCEWAVAARRKEVSNLLVSFMIKELLAPKLSCQSADEFL